LRAKEKDDGAHRSVEVGSLLVEAIVHAAEASRVEGLTYPREEPAELWADIGSHLFRV
jgi:hypothetical protein